MKIETVHVTTGKEFLKLIGADTPEARAKYRKIVKHINRQAARGSRRISKLKPVVIGPQPRQGTLNVCDLKLGYND